MDDVTCQPSLLTRRAREAAARAAAEIERAQDACERARSVLSDLQRVRKQAAR